jgi:hypothetical protein
MGLWTLGDPGEPGIGTQSPTGESASNELECMRNRALVP